MSPALASQFPTTDHQGNPTIFAVLENLLWLWAEPRLTKRARVGTGKRCARHGTGDWCLMEGQEGEYAKERPQVPGLGNWVPMRQPHRDVPRALSHVTLYPVPGTVLRSPSPALRCGGWLTHPFINVLLA